MLTDLLITPVNLNSKLHVQQKKTKIIKIGAVKVQHRLAVGRTKPFLQPDYFVNVSVCSVCEALYAVLSLTGL